MGSPASRRGPAHCFLLVLDQPTADCLVDALSEDEIAALGDSVLFDASFAEGEEAINEALAAHPECG